MSDAKYEPISTTDWILISKLSTQLTEALAMLEEVQVDYGLEPEQMSLIPSMEAAAAHGSARLREVHAEMVERAKAFGRELAKSGARSA